MGTTTATERGAPLRPSKRAHRETLEAAAAAGIVSGLDLARINSSRTSGSLCKVAAEAAAIGARVFATSRAPSHRRWRCYHGGQRCFFVGDSGSFGDGWRVAGRRA
jgi:hypothetical protein